jgi:hypothetical protein
MTMSLTCPTCSQQFEDRVQCPRCRVNLVAPSVREPAVSASTLPGHWSRNPWGRTLLGVLLAQGLYFALKNLVLAGALATGEESAFSGLYTLLGTQALQVVALLAGSFFAGAGQKNGGVYGSMVGVWNGILCTMLQGLHGEVLTAVNLYGTPILHTAIGAFGGLVGAWIWQPMPALASPASSRPVPRPRSRLFELTHAHIHWGRVLIGVAIAAGGYFWADTILQIVLANSDHRLSIRSSIQQVVMTLEIAALAVFLGGAFAGATTWNGAAQGAWVGLFGATLFIGYRVGYLHDPDVFKLALMTAGTLALSLLGGSFGARLLPPLMRAPTRKAGALPASVLTARS